MGNIYILYISDLDEWIIPFFFSFLKIRCSMVYVMCQKPNETVVGGNWNNEICSICGCIGPQWNHQSLIFHRSLVGWLLSGRWSRWSISAVAPHATSSNKNTSRRRWEITKVWSFLHLYCTCWRLQFYKRRMQLIHLCPPNGLSQQLKRCGLVLW